MRWKSLDSNRRHAIATRVGDHIHFSAAPYIIKLADKSMATSSNGGTFYYEEIISSMDIYVLARPDKWISWDVHVAPRYFYTPNQMKSRRLVGCPFCRSKTYRVEVHKPGDILTQKIRECASCKEPFEKSLLYDQWYGPAGWRWMKKGSKD